MNVDETRRRIALLVTVTGMICAAAVSAIAIVAAAFSEKVPQTAMSVLTALLPVVGTWVGTVLAFYFARENFEAAARASERLLAGRTDKPAMDFAIKPKDIQPLLVGDKPESDIKLKEIREKLEEIKRYRIPLMTDGKKSVRYIIHQQPLDSYLADNPTVAAPSLQDLLTSPRGQVVKEGLAFVRDKATLAEAKAAMEASPRCQDVFITDNGLKDGIVLGWLTNNEVQRALQP